MAILSREALLEASDLREKTIKLPTLGPDAEVRIRALAAEYSNAAISQAVKVTQGPRGESTTSLDNGMLELLQVQHGLIDPQLESLDAVKTFARRCGPAFKTLVDEIGRLSGIDEETVARTAATFQGGGTGSAGSRAVSSTNGHG